MRKILLTISVIIGSFTVMAQNDSTERAKMIEDSIKFEKLSSIAKQPYIKGDKWSGAIPVEGITEKTDPNQQYKLLFELVDLNEDSLAGELNSSLSEVARILNLHVTSGIPEKNIIPVIVVHGGAIKAFLNNDNYKKDFKVDNPNIQFIKDLARKPGVKFIACGQVMAFLEIRKEQLVPEMKVALSAKTILSTYQLKGYVLYKISTKEK